MYIIQLLSMPTDMNSTYTYHTFELVTLSVFPFQESYLIPGLIDSRNEALVIGALSKVETYMEQKNLIAISGLSRPAISIIISEMIGKGLIVQSANPDDKRGYLVSLTPLGKKVAAWMIARKQAFNRMQVKGLTEKEIQEFNKITTKMALNVLDMSDREYAKLPKFEDFTPGQEDAPFLIAEQDRRLFVNLSNRVRAAIKKAK